ncbi:hypothetical protein [Flavobacterium aestivum]|uniref:hypothetical protein n=1 Tax=Flavobacterium aestivum TaxID=3003257 RepID=UPI002482DB5C|nr:hypothetical protein [Flavobacterium aestivum]
MINSPVLDTTIGLVFIFLLYSLLATSINEAIATLFSLRARMLKKGIVDGMLSNSKQKEWLWKSILKTIGNIFKEFGSLIIGYRPKQKGKLGNTFYNHPIIKNYGSSDRFSIPSYIPKENFSTILIDVLEKYWESHKENILKYVKENDTTNTIDLENAPTIIKIQYLVKYLQSIDITKFKEEFKANEMYIDPEILQIFALYLDKSYQNIETFATQLETWYDDSMNRISGWYKRQTQFALFFIGLIIAITFNVSIIDIAGKLSTDKDAREKLIEMSIKSVEELKNDRRVQKINDNGSSNQILNPNSETKNDSLSYADYKNEVEKIKAQLNGRVKEANNLLALGWGDYGLKQDSVTTVKKYICELEKLHDTVKKHIVIPPKKIKDSAAIYNHAAMLALYDNHWYKLKVGYVASNFYKGRKPLGFLLLAFGICLGAPFWFDLLQRLIKLRASGKKEDPGVENNTTPNPTTPPVQVTVNNTSNPEAIG